MSDEIAAEVPCVFGERCEGCHTWGKVEIIKIHVTNGVLALCRQCLDDVNRKNPELIELKKQISLRAGPASAAVRAIVRQACEEAADSSINAKASAWLDHIADRHAARIAELGRDDDADEPVDREFLQSLEFRRPMQSASSDRWSSEQSIPWVGSILPLLSIEFPTVRKPDVEPVWTIWVYEHPRTQNRCPTRGQVRALARALGVTLKGS